MADECDFATDVQLKAADAFTASRLRRLALLPSARSAAVCECGALISAARQSAMPGVTLCTICQDKAERLEVTYGRA